MVQLPRRTLPGFYETGFSKVKRDFLALKFQIDMNMINGKKRLSIKKKMNKIATLLFDIERDFEASRERPRRR